ncbi:MAG: lipoyl domain-containing protein [Verrucomicrobia bacterium]|nr:lipoyl domain-containing protein [Verrucomicrobiota bacterium]
MKQVIFDYSSDDVATATVDYWHVDEGDAVDEGDDLVELRTEEGQLFVVSAPAGGILRERFYEPGDEVEVGDIIATIDDGIDVIEPEDLDEDEDEEEDDEEDDEEKEDDDPGFEDLDDGDF